MDLMSGALQNVTETLRTYLDWPLVSAAVSGAALDGHFVLEAILVIVILGLMLQKSYKPEKPGLTEQEIEQLCDEWEPEPLHPPMSKEMLEYKTPVLESAAGPHTVVGGKDVVNFTSMDFLGMGGNPRIKDACVAPINKYGVGSCGPRGFYGTIDVHMDLEEKIAAFMRVEETILYSYGLATPASTIPAFCKRGDLIVVDEGVNWGIQNGLTLSRSTVKFFRHNDMRDLERVLREVKADDGRRRKALNRRFIVVEAVYQTSGRMAPLDEIVRLRDKYFFRLLIDESLSFGVLGATGRGISEHFGIPVEKIDIIVAGMGFTLASVGGFCCGASRMVDHQRLSGLGYCFSASLPPFLACASIAAIDEMEAHPELRTQLRSNVAVLRKALSRVPGLRVGGDETSPVIFLHLSKSPGSFAEDSRLLQRIADKMLAEESVLLAVTKRAPLDRCRLPAGIRIAVSGAHTEADLQVAADALARVAASVLDT